MDRGRTSRLPYFSSHSVERTQWPPEAYRKVLAALNEGKNLRRLYYVSTPGVSRRG